MWGTPRATTRARAAANSRTRSRASSRSRCRCRSRARSRSRPRARYEILNHADERESVLHNLVAVVGFAVRADGTGRRSSSSAARCTAVGN